MEAVCNTCKLSSSEPPSLWQHPRSFIRHLKASFKTTEEIIHLLTSWVQPNISPFPLLKINSFTSALCEALMVWYTTRSSKSRAGRAYSQVLHVLSSGPAHLCSGSHTDNYDVMRFILQLLLCKKCRHHTTVRNHLPGNLTHTYTHKRLLPLARRGCQSNKYVRHIRCQVALSLWKDAISGERRLFLNCSFR